MPIPRGYRQKFDRLALRLRQHEPIRPIHEPRERLGLAVVIGVGGPIIRRLPLARHRHAQHNRLCALPHVSAFILPAHEGGDGSRRNSTFRTLHQREKLIPDAVAVKRGVGARDYAGFSESPVEQVNELRRIDDSGTQRAPAAANSAVNRLANSGLTLTSIRTWSPLTRRLP
jgi:hypothetical protein